MSASGVRRGKAALFQWVQVHPAIAPAGSNRRSHGGNEVAEAFGIACHELVSLDFRCGSKPEVSDGHENVGFRGQSGSRFRATGCLLVPSRPGEFHPEPLTEPDVILSHHPAHAIA